MTQNAKGGQVTAKSYNITTLSPTATAQTLLWTLNVFNM